MSQVRARMIGHPWPLQSVLEEHYRDPWNHVSYDRYTPADVTFALKHLEGIQVTESENHPLWRTRDKRARFTGDLGGPFKTRKSYVESSFEDKTVIQGKWVEYPGEKWETTRLVKYRGPVLPCRPDLITLPPSAASSLEEIEDFGAVAVARCSPSNPAADLSVTFAEFFREGIPRIVGSTLKHWRELTGQERRRAIGGEHLNIEFGWKPLIKDLTDIAQAIVDRHKIIDQYARDSGRLVRRKYRFPPVIETSSTVLAEDVSPWHLPSSSALLNFAEINKGKVVRLEERRIDRWFSGAFTYYVPPADGLRDTLARNVIFARKLLGLSLTPDVLWNLAPWSWAIDWFSNSGDVISNLTDWAIDNQVLAYGYMMEESSLKYTYLFQGPTGFSSGVKVAPVTTVCKTKVRRKAGPYGFGIGWEGLSPRQLSIIAALGLSRS